METSRSSRIVSVGSQATQTLLTSDWLVPALLTALVTYSVYRLLIWPSYIDPLRHIPVAPGSHWFFGHLLRVIKEPTGHPMREWINTVPNDGIIRYYMWFYTRILVTKPEALADVLVTRCYDFSKASIVRNTISRVTSIGLILQEGEVHRANRKSLMPAFAFRQIKNLHPIFWSKARQLSRCLEQEAKKAPSVEIGLWASRATVDIIAWAGMGIEINSLHDPEHPLAQAYRTILTRPVSSPTGRRLQLLGLILPQWVVTNIPCEHNRAINTAVKHIRDFCADLIVRRRQKMAEQKGETEVDVLSLAINAGELTDVEMVNHAMTFMAAGHEASANVITYSLYLLCKHPEIQTKLRSEIRTHIPSNSDDITAEEIERCDYLHAVCLEVLRIWPPVVHTFRTAARDTSICGERITKGSSIILSFWAINASKELWGEDALEFKPERWLDANGRASANGGASSNYSFMSFLHGPRSCIGKGFANAGYACALTAIIGNLEVAFEEGSVLARGEEDFFGSVSTKVRGGMWCTLKKVPGWESG